jgi:hypothetical protein
MPIWVGAEPEQVETEPNDDVAQANEVSAPVTVNAALGARATSTRIACPHAPATTSW